MVLRLVSSLIKAFPVYIRFLWFSEFNSPIKTFSLHSAELHRSVGRTSDCRLWSHWFQPQLGHIIYEEIDHEIIYVAILPCHGFEKGSCWLLRKYVHKFWLST